MCYVMPHVCKHVIVCNVEYIDSSDSLSPSPPDRSTSKNFILAYIPVPLEKYAKRYDEFWKNMVLLVFPKVTLSYEPLIGI